MSSLILFVLVLGQTIYILYLLDQLRSARSAEKAKRLSGEAAQPEREKSTLLYASTDNPRTGRVVEVFLGSKAFGSSPVTLFNIEDESGTILYAGIPGHTNGLEVGQAIEFWLSDAIIANQSMTEHMPQGDGSVEVVNSTRYYYTLHKYRVLRKQKD